VPIGFPSTAAFLRDYGGFGRQFGRQPDQEGIQNPTFSQKINKKY
jgi:hypothetical protein